MTRIALAAILLSTLAVADDSSRLLRVDHYVRVRSTVPAIAGQMTQIYVREVVEAGVALRNTSPDRVVLFIHGAGTPAEVAYDVPYQDYSWMAHLARAGYDVFSMDMTGYGRSTRPPPMNDPCNLSAEQQTAVLPSPCPPTYAQNMTTLASDWNDIDAVVNHLRSLRRVERVSLFGWSLGGPRAGGYAAQHQDKVSKLILLAPGYSREARADAPEQVPAKGAAMAVQSLADFNTNWDRQVGCSDQIDPLARASVWSEMLKSDPVAATWGTGMRRAPLVTNWGWTKQLAASLRIPILLLSPAHDKQVKPESVRNLYEDAGSTDKILVDLACTSHNALWEKNHLLMFNASLEFLKQGSVNGARHGVLRVGY